MTFASLPSITATTELVVPKSMPMIFSPAAMLNRSFYMAIARVDRSLICVGERAENAPSMRMPRPPAQTGSRQAPISKGCARLNASAGRWHKALYNNKLQLRRQVGR